MQSILIRSFGGPEVLELETVPTPTPNDGEVLIRVTRAGVNFADLSRRDGSYGTQVLPQIMGVEVVGHRADSNERVVALLPRGGGYAEYAVSSENLTFPIPDGVSDDQAVALFEQGLTAYHALFSVGRVQPGESVVVHAAAGGVGSLAVQLARLHNAGRVIAVASSQEKRKLALELGAHKAIDSQSEGLTERIREANGGRGVNVILEMVGGTVFDASFAALAPFGRLVVYGQASDEANAVSTDDLMEGSKAVLGYWLWHTLEQRELVISSLEQLFGLVRAGQLRVVVGATYPLKQARQAHIDLASRRTTGKLLLDPTG